MIKKNDKFFQNYTISDLKYFELLEDYRKYNINSKDLNSTINFFKPIHYTKSDQKQFLNIMNSNHTSSQENTIDYSINKEVKTNDRKGNFLEDSFYNESDIKKFKKLKKLPLHVDSYSSRYSENNKKDLITNNTHYKTEDLSLFNRIYGSNENNKKNNNHNNLKSTIDRNSIKILDFDKFQKNNKINKKKNERKN